MLQRSNRETSSGISAGAYRICGSQSVARFIGNFWSVTVKTFMKRTLMWAYCHNLISMSATQRIYGRLGLSEY